MTREKKFECKKGCNDLELELLIFKCKKCIKRTGIYPTKEIKKAIKGYKITP